MSKAFENTGFLTPGGDRGLIFLSAICQRQFYTSWRGERQNAFSYVINDLSYTVTMCTEVVMGVFKLPKCLYQSFTLIIVAAITAAKKQFVLDKSQRLVYHI